MPREIIRPAYGEPCIVQLATDPSGVQREGQSGVDYQYILNNDQSIMWLPKDGRDAVIKSGAQDGDEIRISKSKRGRQTIWEVDRIAVEPPPTTQTPPASWNETREQTAIRQQQQYAQHIAAESKSNATPPADKPPASPGEDRAQQRPGSNHLLGALCAAIDAVNAANQYASDRYGMQNLLEGADVRILAITLYIQAHKDGAK